MGLLEFQKQGCRTLRQGLGAGALAAIMVAIVSFAVGASPLMKSSSPFESISSQISLSVRRLSTPRKEAESSSTGAGISARASPSSV